MATFETQKPPFESAISKKIDTAAGYKNKGNECFKEGAFKKALINYSKGLAFTKGLPGRSKGLDGLSKLAMDSVSKADKVSPEDDMAIHEIEVVLKTNIATCCLKLNEPAKALIHTSEALDINPSAWKAHLRKAEALLMLNDLDRASVALTEVAAIAPEEAGTAVVRLRERLGKQRKAEVAQQRKAFGNIFSRKEEGEGKGGEGKEEGKETEVSGEKMDSST
jgi:tetratricopeptide (TPR) repeat protein